MNKPHGKHPKPAIQIKLGKAIRGIRKTHSKCFSQEDFANEAEINRGYYGSIERGEVNVSILTLEKICTTLKITFEELFRYAKL